MAQLLLCHLYLTNDNCHHDLLNLAEILNVKKMKNKVDVLQDSPNQEFGEKN
jgi:hypothetical protein